ncbi:MAG: polyprenyl synthetase family protein [Candidatus Thermoplasmatota archaeon]|jgi:octaprenyl-diphosphate synthase|nr:polyprenyl synthetase family protein [Candidatus Thermoplasmatota archaeon]
MTLDMLDLDLGIYEELDLVEEQIRERIDCGISTINEVARHVIDAGGKRIRPGLFLLSFKALRGEDISKVAPLAAAFELIHTGTILHDDINDGSILRHGKLTAHQKFGTTNSLVTGDYLFAKAFEIGSEYKKEIRDVILDASIGLAVGEIIQSQNIMNIDLTEKKYLDIIEKKTAGPISASAKAGGIMAGGTGSQIKILADFGLNMGIAFQIMDDILDVIGINTKTGKSVGKDISEGKLTILSIHALKHASPLQRERLKEVLLKTDNTNQGVSEAIDIIKNTQSVDFARNMGKKYADIAIGSIDNLPDSKWKSKLKYLAEFTIGRNY